MHALIVDTDARSAARTQQALLAYEIKSRIVGLGSLALLQTTDLFYDIILVEDELGDLSGCAFVEALRGVRNRTPVMVVSAQNEVFDRVRALALGADDYLGKPFDAGELAARVNAIVRRYQGGTPAMQVSVGRLSINMFEGAAFADGVRMHLTATEYRILEALALNKGKTVTTAMFLEHLYKGAFAPEEKIIQVYISKMRKKISGYTGGPHYIETDWGRGYILMDEAEASAWRADPAHTRSGYFEEAKAS